MVLSSDACKLSILVACGFIGFITENDVGASVGCIFFVRNTGNNLCILVACGCTGQNPENILGIVSIVQLFDA